MPRCPGADAPASRLQCLGPPPHPRLPLGQILSRSISGGLFEVIPGTLHRTPGALLCVDRVSPVVLAVAELVSQSSVLGRESATLTRQFWVVVRRRAPGIPTVVVFKISPPLPVGVGGGIVAGRGVGVGVETNRDRAPKLSDVPVLSGPNELASRKTDRVSAPGATGPLPSWQPALRLERGHEFTSQ